MSDTAGQTIKCLAAVCRAEQDSDGNWKPGKLTVEEIKVAPPQDHEVRVKILYTGICHTDEYTRSGKDPEGIYPVILGHEGSGIVESIGPHVTNVDVGDPVVLLYTAECRECKFCKSGKTNLCSKVRATQGKGVMPENGSRFTDANGQTIYHFMGTSTFSQYTVVADVSIVAIKEGVPLDKACLFGCAIPTAWGAVTKLPRTVEEAAVKEFAVEGSTVAVFGCGAIGLGVLHAARQARAGLVIAIDTSAKKEQMAKDFGAHIFINASTLPEGKRIQDYLVEGIDITGIEGVEGIDTQGGPDFTFDCTGNVEVMRAALEACHKGWGVSTVIGVAAAGEMISTRPFQLVTGRTWRGTAFGGVKGRTELPGLINEYLLKWDSEDLTKFNFFKTYISHRTTLAQIQDGFDAMHSGNCIRCIVKMPEEKGRLV